MESYAPSVIPTWLLVPIGIVTALLITPFVLVVAIPILVVVPAAVPFIFVAFLGDFRGEQEAYEEALKKYESWKLPPLWTPDHLPIPH
ncbi:MAG: hypothetical protein GXY23_02005 [Myxococcales bacterium]|jgi:hypothetical protein|nr:hypothetical protein [Myxococcales bacterium]